MLRHRRVERVRHAGRLGADDAPLREDDLVRVRRDGLRVLVRVERLEQEDEPELLVRRPTRRNTSACSAVSVFGKSTLMNTVTWPRCVALPKTGRPSSLIDNVKELKATRRCSTRSRSPLRPVSFRSKPSNASNKPTDALQYKILRRRF